MTGAATLLYTVLLDRGLSWEAVAALREQHEVALALEASGIGSPAAGPNAVLASVPVQQQQAEEAEEEEGKAEGNGTVVEPPAKRRRGGQRSAEPAAALDPTADGEPEAKPAAAEQAPAPPKKEVGEEEAGPAPKSGGSEEQGEEEGAEEADSGREEEEEEPGPSANGKSAKKKGKGGKGAQDAKDGDNTGAKRKLQWVSGFYRVRPELVRGRVHVLLALQVPGSAPPTFTVHRPGTGRSKQIFSLQARAPAAAEPSVLPGPLEARGGPSRCAGTQPNPSPLPPSPQELKAKYTPLSPERCKKLWEEAHKAAGVSQDARPSLRHRTVHILGGAVMRCWGAVQVRPAGVVQLACAATLWRPTLSPPAAWLCSHLSEAPPAELLPRLPLPAPAELLPRLPLPACRSGRWCAT